MSETQEANSPREEKKRQQLQESKADRMARYKEERRRQLAAQFNETTNRLAGGKDGSSSASEGPRMTRTARLRAAANSSPSTPGKEPRSSPASSLASHADLPRRLEKEKDKSGKRKSNLNRSLTSEEVAIDINDDSKARRRRRRFFPPEVLQQSLNTSSNEDKQRSDASLTANNMSPLSSPITAAAIATVKTTPRRSELSVHMENARKGVTAPAGKNNSSRSSPKRISPRLENKENFKRKTDEGVNGKQRADRNKVPNVNNNNNDAEQKLTRSSRSSRRLDELAALTRDTLAHVERIAKQQSKVNAPEEKSEVKNTEATPVSILKRKVSQDESKSVVNINTPPVTFSPNVIEPTPTKRKQGILKKRRSLDESQVLRHRSCSPDMASKSDSKSILKNQRRSSLEEITHLADSSLTSILKRKTSRCEEENLDNSLNSPQGILKRRSGASSAGSTTSTHHHVSITTAVILAAAEGAEMILDNSETTMRPILKKKSISDDGENDSLKPILKKKSSTDTDDGEDRPKRPILKLTRSSDSKDSDYSKYYSANESGSECEVRPILKSSTKDESPRPRLSFCADDDVSLQNGEEEHYQRRRNKRLNPNDYLTVNGSNGNATREMDRDVTRPRIVSVSELVMSFEKSTGAIPKKSSFKRNSDRCRTQPITMNEFEASLSYMKSPQLEDFPRLAQSSPSSNSHSSHSLLDLATTLGNAERLNTYFSNSLPIANADCGGKMSSDSAFQSLGDGLELEQEEKDTKNSITSKVNAGIQRYKNKSLGADRAGYSRYPTQPVTLDEVQEAARINIDANSNNEQNTEPETNEPDPSKLSFSERIKLFTKKPAEEERPQVADFEKRRLRRVTQPITANEVETALFLNHNNNNNKGDKPPTLSPCALGNETFADRRGILKSKLDFSGVTIRRKQQQQREKSRSPPPPLREYSPNMGLKDPVDFTYDEGISSNDSESDSDVKIVVASEKGVCAKKPSRYINGSDHTSDESSGGREIQSIIGKEAIAKRRQMRERLSSDGYITKSRSQANVGDDIGQRPSSNSAAMPRGTIGELQAKLQQSGDNDWRKRLPKLNNASEELNLLNVKNLYNDKLSEKGSILEAKKDELDASARQWKSRVEKSDANEFSVAGRMQIKDIPSVPINIPTVDKVRRIPKAKRFKGKGGDDGKDTSSTPVSPDIDESLGFKRSISVPANSTDDSSGSESSLRSSGRKVAVFRPDDDTFKSFFKSVDVTRSEEHVEVSLDAFDCVIRETDSLLASKKNIKVQRRKATSRNPVKALAARSDIQNEYTEIITGVAERETKRLNIEKLTKNSNLAVEALAGLASKEDFAAVALKKSSAPNISYLPFTNLMLLQVKGRRHVQTRLVEPASASINKGDNYILVTPNALYHYIGAYSNVIEQSRAADIINHIQQSGDMGCKIEKAISINTKKSLFSKDLDKFWGLLGAEHDVEVAGAGHPDEDEVYESSMVDTNMIYCVENKELVPLEDYWGKIPKIEILTPSRVLVFDFGSEMYVWSGKNANPEEKKVALKLAKELWDNGYNYTECAVCPITVAKMIGERAKVGESNMKSESRPEWALFAKITQHRETILFREKFLDWPDYSRVIKVKSNGQEKSTETTFDIKPCDASSLLKFEYSEPDLEVEGSHLGRGKCYFDAETNRNFEINTLDVTCWVTLENTYEELGSECFGHFYDGDSYIVRWRFRVTVTGRELSGKPSKHAQLGRDRCVYFCWLGKNASINEKGAAALLTVELDSEQAKQIRITQGSEPPAFLQLFDGKMFIHSGKRDSEKAPTRLYISRGEIEHETVLIEVPCSMRSLRSRTSFVFIETNKITLWHGSKSLNQSRTVTKTFVDYIRANKPNDFNFTSSGRVELNVVEEGDEKATFLCELEKRQLYNSLVKASESYEDMPRMFYFESVSSGVFEAMEILCPHRSLYPTPYPFLQTELYSANQPALFLIDNGHELWLWQGWWPDRENDDLELSEQTGSGAMRWQAERRAAMQTAIDYWHSKNADAKSVPAYLVWAGLEPLAFTNLFPVWCDRDDIAELNIKEGKKAGDMVLIEKELALLTRTTYPLAELLQRPLPDGVDPTHLEKYLSPDDFTDLLSMTLEEFNKLPAWKQTALKKEHGLF